MRAATVAAVLLLAACAAEPAPEAPRVNAFPPDTAVVRVGGPTFIAFAPPSTERQLEADAGLAATLDDFGWFVASASDSLRALGFAIVGRTGDSVRVLVRGRQFTFVPERDSARVGYLLLAPDRGPRVAYGVHADSILVAIARAYIAGDSAR